MENFLKNGTVLPHGLLSSNSSSMMAGFNKTYRNTALRVGMIIETYPVSSDKNRTHLTTEYDVLVFEQNEDKGSTLITYKNCLSSDGLGSIADFFEKTLRTNKISAGKKPKNLKGQNGSAVLILCLDSMSEKAIIVGFFPHPDRKTNLKDKEPHLEGEYNGIHVVINSDGSASLTFKGATDNDGKVVDSSQGNTDVKIEKDGSYQVGHKTVTQRLDKSGAASLTADGDISNATKKNFNATATESINLTATKDFNLTSDKIVASAKGSASLACEKLDIQAQSEIGMQGSKFQVEAQSLAKIKATQIVLDGMVSLGGQGGQPILLLSTMMMGIGNLGIPVISQAISGYAVKVTAQ